MDMAKMYFEDKLTDTTNPIGGCSLDDAIDAVKQISTDKDMVNHPSHYTHGSIEVIDYIQDNLGDDGCIDYCLGNCIKYISRCKFKGTMITDLKKCRWYLDKVIDILEKMEDKAINKIARV